MLHKVNDENNTKKPHTHIRTHTVYRPTKLLSNDIVKDLHSHSNSD